MSFLSGILSVGKSAVKFLSGNSIWSSLAKTAILGLAVNKLSKSALKGNDNDSKNIDQGVRLQAKPDAAAKIPVLYGGAFFGGNISDAAMTNANKTMWYCLVLSEKTGTVYSTSAASTYTLNNVYWNNQRIVFNSDGVTANYTVDSTGVIDRSISGLVRVYFYAGGRTAGQVPSGYSGTVPNAETLFPNWTSGTHAMSNLIFALVRVDYNREKNVTGIGDMLFNVTNSMKFPGDVLYDYLTNTTYGAGISASNILTTDITALNTYSDATVAYDDQGTGAQTLADRYQINGLIDTAQPVLENAEKILSSAASWLSYDTHAGKWGVVINKADTSVASFDDSNILGNISLSGTGLQDLYNQVKVEFPHRELRDSADFYNIEIPESSIPADWADFSRNGNEEDNVLNLTYDIINEPVQAQMLGLIELKQSRLDKVIQFETDFSYYNLKAGDIIDVTNTRFSFSSKLFRIVSITERQDEAGALMMEITALEYNANVYSVADLYRFTRSDDNGIITIGSIGQPGTPVVSKIEQDARPRVEITSSAPTGVVEGMEFWLTTDVGIPDDANRSYTLIGVKRPVGGGVYTSGTNVTLEYVTSASDFFVKTRGFNATTVGQYSAVSGLVEFAPVQTTDAIDANTQAFDSTGGLLGALALVELLGKVSDLFGAADAGKSVFDRIFEIFEDETGVDLVGDAAGGSLVVASNLTTKADGTNLSTATNSLDFQGVIDATGSGDIAVKIEDGVENKEIIAWNKELGQWQRIAGCIECEFENLPPDPGGAKDCYLTIDSTQPANNFSLGSLCPSDSTVPYTGSYFFKLGRVRARDDAEAIGAGSISAGTEYEVALINNTDFRWWGGTNTVGAIFTAQNPATLFPQGRLVSDILVGKRYTILTLGDTDWESIGADAGAVVGDEFTATSVGSGTGTVSKANGLGWVYPPGDFLEEKPLLTPVQPGVGSVKLYGTDGVLEQELTESQILIHNDVIELPFAPRQPGKDYYILIDDGLITFCDCENKAFDNSAQWTFTTSLTPRTPYSIPAVTAVPDGDNTDYNSPPRKIDFTFTPQGSLCSANTELVLRFSQKVKKGTGSILIKNRLTGSTATSLSVSGASITEETDDDGIPTGYWLVNFGAISGLAQDTYYDVSAPQGLVVTDIPATSSTICGSTTNTPAGAEDPNVAKTWGLKTEVALRLTQFQYCPEQSGNAKARSNLVLTFNKAFQVKSTGPAYVYIYEGSGSLHQKIDLRGTFADDAYGTVIYGYTESTSIATGEAVTSYGSTLTLNPTKPFKGNTDYYINIDSGTLLDPSCDIVYPGISDTNTAAWRTDGIAATPPDGPTYGSLYIDLKFDRPVTPGYGKVNVITSTGVLVTQVSSRDWTVVFKDNVPFE